MPIFVRRHNFFFVLPLLLACVGFAGVARQFHFVYLRRCCCLFFFNYCSLYKLNFTSQQRQWAWTSVAQLICIFHSSSTIWYSIHFAFRILQLNATTMPSMFQLHITNYYAEIIFLFGEFKFAFNVIFFDITTHTSQTYSTKKTNKSKNNKKYSVCAVVSALACLFGAKKCCCCCCVWRWYLLLLHENFSLSQSYFACSLTYICMYIFIFLAASHWYFSWFFNCVLV